MKQMTFLSLLFWFVVFSKAQETENSIPVVTNVVAEQIDFDHVLIRYDLEDVNGDLMIVSVKVSADAKKSFDVPVTQLEGDVGEGITTGKNKEIVWNISQDILIHQYGKDYAVAVIADDGVNAEINWHLDGSKMLLIPAGSFQMGDQFNQGDPDEQPLHRIILDQFYMDETEVTNRQYQVFVAC